MEPRIRETQWNKQLEAALLAQWAKEQQPFLPGGTALTIDTPPPYPSGRPWHVGAAAHYAQIDMIARASRLLGWNVLFPIGIDRNGLPVEMYTEKKFGISIHTTPREQFLQKCTEALDELEAEMLQIMRAMGLSGDFSRVYHTDDPAYRALTQASFIRLWKQGLVSQDSRLNNWCPGCKTTVADNEVAYRDIPTFLNHVALQVAGSNERITIATTRPELLCTAALVIYNPKDERYQHLAGKQAVIPLYEREVPIMAHPIADPAFGTGLAYMSRSAGDLNAVRFLREQGIPYEVCIGEDGRMNAKAGFLEGLLVKQARARIRELLKEKGFLAKEEQISHRTPVCERSKHEIEYIAMPEFYLKQLPFLTVLEKYAKQIAFHPEAHRSLLLNWIRSVSMDWPISRRRFYGTEIPIWYCASCGEAHLPPEGGYVQPWKDPAPFPACAKCGHAAFRGEERTFDTWMDSSISPLVVTRFFTDPAFHAATAGRVIRPQSKDIVRTWLFYTLLRCHQLTGKRIFSDAWIMGYGVDEKGEKMSKSKGNVIDPIPILESQGADTFRFWSAQETGLGSDFRCSEEKIAGTGKFLSKLWNASRLISSFPEAKKPRQLAALDQWILGELRLLVQACKEGYQAFDFSVPANLTRAFLWNVFAAHYMELAKTRAYAGDPSACFTLHACLRTLLVLLSPITPFSTDHLYRVLYGGSVFQEPFPKAAAQPAPPFSTDALLALDSAIWKAKKDRGLSLKAEVTSLTLPQEFRQIEYDVKQTHNVKELNYGKSVTICLESQV
ncbi:MAG: valine--tRNA ligase [Candidatus Aenigmarchaeota archaeon]|nr:valine--tRNA ligase [Candidatus Aenigmarchaeota archaeon]